MLIAIMDFLLEISQRNFLKSQIVRFLENADLQSRRSRCGDDSQVARGGGSGVGAHVVAWWGPGAYP